MNIENVIKYGGRLTMFYAECVLARNNHDSMNDNNNNTNTFKPENYKVGSIEAI